MVMAMGAGADLACDPWVQVYQDREEKEEVNMGMKTRGVIMGMLAAIVLPAGANAKTMYVNSTDGLRIREEANTQSETISVLPFGSAVELAEEKAAGNWYAIEHDGSVAYVCKQFVQETDPLEDYTYMGCWRTTAYAYTGSACANGEFPEVNYTIACNSLPFGAVVYIRDVGFRTVEDRGPESMGSEWLDIYMGDVGQCIQWGDQYHDVYLVEE